MGQPAPAGVGASGLPPSGDKANAVISGIITAVGPTAPFAFYGPFNVNVWASINTALTTTVGSSGISVTSGTGLAVGNAVNSINVPLGTTFATFSGTTGTLAFPPGVTNASVTTGTDNAATFTGAAINFSGTIQLEKSFNGGATWSLANIAQTGTIAQWTAGTPLSQTFSESEKQVLYRLNCIAYTSGTINYRLSETGIAALSASTSTSI
jgi:hypothetical protein